MKKVVTQGLWERPEKRWKRENRRLLRRLTKAYEQLRDAEKKASGSALGAVPVACRDTRKMRAYDALMRRGLIRAAFGDGRDGQRLYWQLTEKGRKELEP